MFQRSTPDQMQSQPLDDSDDEIDLLAIAGTLWRGKLIIAAAGLVALMIGFYQAYVVAVPVYTASAKVALQNREEQVVTDLESVVSGLSSDQSAINTELEVMRSRVLIERVVRALDLTEDPEFNGYLRDAPGFSLSPSWLIGTVSSWISGPPPEPAPPTDREVMDRTINAVLNAISVSNIRSSYVFQINAVTQDRRKSAILANTMADVYIGDQLQVKQEATEQASAWLSERVAELQITLENAEAALSDYNATAQLVSPEALEALNRQVKDTRDRLAEVRRTAEQAAASVAELEAARDSGDRSAMAELAQDRTLDRILDMVGTGGAAASTFDDRFDQVIERSRLEAQRAEGQAISLERSLAELEAQIDQQSQDLVVLQQLQREAEATRLIYESFLTRLKEISVQQGIQQADSRLLSAAVVPNVPSAPNRTRILALSLILGVIVGAGAVLLREMMQNTFRTAEDLERATGRTVMGQIPLVPTKRRQGLLQYLVEKPSSPAAEAIRNLRTSVMLSDVDKPPQVIMSTSSVPGEGKTTQSISLAQNFGRLGKRVLLIEGDIRRRVFSEYFEVRSERGLLSVLSGEADLEDIVQYEEGLMADVLLGEKSNVNAADIFSSNSFSHFLAKVRDLYDIIIIDTPPVLVVPDARVIGQSVDAILYSVKWDSTSKSQVEDGLRMLATVNLRVTGLILAQVNPKGMRRYGYGDRYGAYAAYGKKYYDA